MKDRRQRAGKVIFNQTLSPLICSTLTTLRSRVSSQVSSYVKLGTTQQSSPGLRTHRIPDTARGADVERKCRRNDDPSPDVISRVLCFSVRIRIHWARVQPRIRSINVGGCMEMNGYSDYYGGALSRSR